MRIVLLIGLGGMAGTFARYFFQVFFSRFSPLPLATFVANMLGCFLIGVIFGLHHKQHISDNLRLIMATGFCGGFTTFSAFALENYSFFTENNFKVALAYIGLSILLGILAVYFGNMISKELF
jgi:fluoride exporter